MLMVFTFSCGPQYKTVHSLTPPSTERGRSCIFQCENAKLQCVQNERLSQQNCNLQAELVYQNCQTKAQTAYDACVAGGSTSCFKGICIKKNCPLNTVSCDDSYRSCYSVCGGTVTSETICVLNCNEEPLKRGTPAYRDANGTGGYKYRQFSDGTIEVRPGSPALVGKRLSPNPNDPVWAAITAEIGPYRRTLWR